MTIEIISERYNMCKISHLNKLSYNKLVVVVFSAFWSGRSYILEKSMQNVEKDLGDAIEVVHIDSDQDIDLCAFYNIWEYPTILILKFGSVVYRAAGFFDKTELLKRIESHSLRYDTNQEQIAR